MISTPPYASCCHRRMRQTHLTKRARGKKSHDTSQWTPVDCLYLKRTPQWTPRQKHVCNEICNVNFEQHKNC